MNIQHDPARRIRRIQRLKQKPGEDHWLHMCSSLYDTICESNQHDPKYVKLKRRHGRLVRAWCLMDAELAWLCSYSDGLLRMNRAFANGSKEKVELLMKQSETIAEQKARIEELENRVTALKIELGRIPNPGD